MIQETALGKTKLKLEKLVSHHNIAELLGEDALAELGARVVNDYKADHSSRSEWETRVEKAVKLTLQVQEEKSFPWANASNIKLPLLTIAALQFLARVSIMTKGRKIAKVESYGQDADGRLAARAERISKHLSLQLTEQDTNWLDSDEQAKLACCIIGSAFKKTYYDSLEGIVVSEHVPVMNLVVDYFCKDIEKANRVTQVIQMSPNDIQERVRRGVFLKTEAAGGSREHTLLALAADTNEGLHNGANSDGMTEMLEQHGWIDLDGDGYAEPYVISVCHTTGHVFRIVARYTDTGDVHRLYDDMVKKLEAKAAEAQDYSEKSKLEKEADSWAKRSDNHIVRITALSYFTRYLFIPSPDGGVYGLGLGALIGPLNESANTLVNQLTDAGTMANTAGGFLGRGVKLKGGKTTFDPFEWKPVDSPGGALRDNIFPLPVREPSAVLFQLLGMLVTYVEKTSGATDIMTGIAPGQNTPAETSRNTVEQGMMLFSGIFARLHRGFTRELRKFYQLNQIFLETSSHYQELTQGSTALLSTEDYKALGLRVFPAVGAESVNQGARRDKASMLLQLAGSRPGFDVYAVTKQYLEAFDVDDIDTIYPNPKGPKALPPPVNQQLELDKVSLQADIEAQKQDMQLAVAQLTQDAQLNDAKVVELQAKAAKLLAEAKGVDTGHQIALMDAQLSMAKHHQSTVFSALTLLQKMVAGKKQAAPQQQQEQQQQEQAQVAPQQEQQ